MSITSKTKIIIIIGDPVEHSLSPHIHNSAYKALGIDGEFVFVGAHVYAENLKKAIDGMRALQIHGVTVTVPHKTTVMQYLDEIDETAKKIGAVNTIVNKNGKLIGYNTDWIGIMESLKKETTVMGKFVAIIGAGGAAHAACFAVLSLGARVTIFNRNINNARGLAENFNSEFSPLKNTKHIAKADIIINTTPVGLNSDVSPVDAKVFHADQIAFDCIYRPYETKFLRLAKEKGAKIIHGTEMLIHQATAQFTLQTGKRAPIDIMRKAILDTL